MPDYNAAVRQMEKAGFDEFELDAVLRVIGFIGNREHKGQLVAHRAPKSGLVEIEVRSYIGRNRFMNAER